MGHVCVKLMLGRVRVVSVEYREKHLTYTGLGYA